MLPVFCASQLACPCTIWSCAEFSAHLMISSSVFYWGSPPEGPDLTVISPAVRFADPIEISYTHMQEKISQSLLDSLQDENVWQRYLEYKQSRSMDKGLLKDLQGFIENREYLPVTDGICAGSPFALPRKAVINKLSTKKQRTVYTYPRPENYVLKLLTFLLLRKYDYIFCPCLYSFRPGTGAKDAIRWLSSRRGISQMYCYKADIHDYFNSVDVSLLLPMLRNTLLDDPELFGFLESLLLEPDVIDGTARWSKDGAQACRIIQESKGIMAGTPLASFYANIYLWGMDNWFYEQRIPYARYSDDIIVFAHTEEELERYIAFIHSFLADMHLTMNPDKELRSAPGEAWIFLGVKYQDGTVDIAPASLLKLKHKMRRKARALKRWQERKGLPGDRAAKAFIKVFNRKLFDRGPQAQDPQKDGETPEAVTQVQPAFTGLEPEQSISGHTRPEPEQSISDHELSWCRWYFPVINTAESLAEIDHYAQECIRWLMTGTRTKARYNARYQDLKALGYRSLVNEYYRQEKEARTEDAETQ